MELIVTVIDSSGQYLNIGQKTAYELGILVVKKHLSIRSAIIFQRWSQKISLLIGTWNILHLI